MASLKDIRRRISAVKNTQKVTRAMKLVAAARLRRAQQAALDARPYSTGLYDSAMRISERLGSRAPAMWRRPEEINCVDMVVITSDRGLCGGFNENLLRTVEGWIEDSKAHGIDTKFYAAGKKGVRYFSSKVHDFEAVPADGGDSAMAKWLVERLMERYGNHESAGGSVAFNRFINAARQKPTFWDLLPLHRRGSSKVRNLEYLYEPGRDAALDKICKQMLEASLLQALSESHAAELAARMSAMDNATKNADDMIAHLTSLYNRARQEAITSELMDIVGGAEALK